jgi:hypothetical protein
MRMADEIDGPANLLAVGGGGSFLVPNRLVGLQALSRGPRRGRLART